MSRERETHLVRAQGGDISAMERDAEGALHLLKIKFGHPGDSALLLSHKGARIVVLEHAMLGDFNVSSCFVVGGIRRRR